LSLSRFVPPLYDNSESGLLSVRLVKILRETLKSMEIQDLAVSIAYAHETRTKTFRRISWPKKKGPYLTVRTPSFNTEVFRSRSPVLRHRRTRRLKPVHFLKPPLPTDMSRKRLLRSLNRECCGFPQARITYIVSSRKVSWPSLTYNVRKAASSEPMSLSCRVWLQLRVP
jgi:hypothetical protein